MKCILPLHQTLIITLSYRLHKWNNIYVSKLIFLLYQYVLINYNSEETTIKPIWIGGDNEYGISRQIDDNYNMFWYFNNSFVCQKREAIRRKLFLFKFGLL